MRGSLLPPASLFLFFIFFLSLFSFFCFVLFFVCAFCFDFSPLRFDLTIKRELGAERLFGATGRRPVSARR